MAGLGGLVEGRVADVVFRLDVRSAAEQEGDDFAMALRGGPVQRLGPVLARRVDEPRPVGEQLLDHVPPAEEGGVVEWRVAGIVLQLGVGAGTEKKGDGPSVARKRGLVQGGFTLA